MSLKKAISNPVVTLREPSSLPVPARRGKADANCAICDVLDRIGDNHLTARAAFDRTAD
jgi:hypothetical protein